ncbi:MAG: tRNA preQ1(34) S-adenosylmethionine ribosyltransferase-isomerase QueA [Pirellulales bacterium]
MSAGACASDGGGDLTSAYDYDLPADLVAQEPLADRTAARLLVVHRATGMLEHRHVRDLPEILRPGDLVVVNETKVVPARLVGRRARTGGKWEGLFLRLADGQGGTWEILAHTRGRPDAGERILVEPADGGAPLVLTLVGRAAGGAWLVRPDDSAAPFDLLARFGRVPLPGYIRHGEAVAADRDRYQTVFARTAGSAAAPTAGLHFTPDLLAALAARGIGRAAVTLHVGLGTFRPIATERVADHPMHSEWCACPAETVAAVATTRAAGGRVVAIGTTSLRTLETAARNGVIAPWQGATDLFVTPGYPFRVVDCLLTNFHLPRTTLLVLVSALAGRDLIRRAYAEAIHQRYRLLSYGDAMLIE